MSKRKQDNYDFLDDLFDKHMNDESFINSSISDFGKMVRDSINEEAKNNGYDSLSDMIQGEIQNSTKNASKSKTPISRTIERRTKHYESRYDYFVDALKDLDYINRHRGYYREGHSDACVRYLDQAELSRNNLCALEKIVQEEIRSCAKDRKHDKYSEGYYEGLKFVQRCLLQSKSVLMDEVNRALVKEMNS